MRKFVRLFGLAGLMGRDLNLREGKALTPLDNSLESGLMHKGGVVAEREALLIQTFSKENKIPPDLRDW